MNNQCIPLNYLPIGGKASVAALNSDGITRRRLLDLGFIAGAAIEALYKNPAGNPVAYLIRGAVIALRSDTSEKIMVSTREE